jgi:hypothetical protein
MSTSEKKLNTSIENIDSQFIPEKDTLQPDHKEHFHYPFRMNKRGKCQRELVSLIKEKIEIEPILLIIIIIGDTI